MRTTKQLFTSPDGVLQFAVALEDNDLIVGFLCKLHPEPIFFGHTHGDILAAQLGLPVDKAIESYMNDVISDRVAIAVMRTKGNISDIFVPEDPGAELEYSDVQLELRYWSGKSWMAS